MSPGVLGKCVLCHRSLVFDAWGFSTDLDQAPEHTIRGLPQKDLQATTNTHLQPEYVRIEHQPMPQSSIPHPEVRETSAEESKISVDRNEDVLSQASVEEGAILDGSSLSLSSSASEGPPPIQDFDFIDPEAARTEVAAQENAGFVEVFQSEASIEHDLRPHSLGQDAERNIPEKDEHPQQASIRMHEGNLDGSETLEERGASLQVASEADQTIPAHASAEQGQDTLPGLHQKSCSLERHFLWVLKQSSRMIPTFHMN